MQGLITLIIYCIVNNFGEFSNSLQIRQSVIHQLLAASEKNLRAGLKFVNVFQ